MGDRPTAEPYEAMALLRSLADRGQAVFTVSDARAVAGEAGVAPSYLNVVLRRLREGGWIQRIKRGTYAMTGGMPGLPPELHPFAVGMALVDPCAISGWAALNHHGLTEQIPRVIGLTTPKRVATPAMRGAVQTAPSNWRVAEHDFELVSVVPAHFFGYEETWMGEARVKIFDRERALLDCFALPRKFGGVSEGLAIVEQHLRELDVARLVAHAQRYDKDAAIKRIGYALEIVGADPSEIDPLRRRPVKGYRLLDPTKPKRGRRDGRWALQDNLRPDAPR
ncbi:MAG: type IV toxin-antitoxin system AbiEi family antitoxin domain-containing protein [Proteobacteria bacterium]|nr:type IV toxin-antitoxin system AbiEi family antitoxin domain-containing protein [Pseudomonadota bacterium]